MLLVGFLLDNRNANPIAIIGYCVCIIALAMCQALDAASADTITLAAFIAAIYINRCAALFVAAHLLNDQLFNAISSPIYYNLSAGVAYAIAGAVFIKLSYELRQVFIGIAALFWLSAVDFYLFPDTETMLYNSFAYIVGAVDLYALYLMLSGGSDGGRLYRLCEHWFFILRYRILWVSNLRY